MKILLINPPARGGQSRDGRCQTEGSAWITSFPPTTFAGIAGAIRRSCPDYQLKVMDCIGCDMDKDEAFEKAISFSADLLILNTSTPTIISDLEFAQEIKESSSCKILAYGAYVDAKYGELIDKEQIDYAILSEPETPIINVISGKERSKGVAFKGWDGGKWMEKELDDLPFPAYDLLPPYYYPLSGERWMFVRTGRGCPYKCIYCTEPMNFPTPRYHSVKYLMKQFHWLVDELGIRTIMFWDEVATYDKGHMIELCKALISEGLSEKIKWFCTTRVDHFDDELAGYMKQAGCRMVTFGFESGDQKVLDMNKKGITIEQSKDAVKAAKNHGLMTIGHFIIGLLGDTPQTARKTSKFARDLRINFAQFYIATPFPGLEFFKIVSANGWLDEKAKVIRAPL